ncbi:uncharacterized protein PV09_04762 [Verruconis gallopava]|uniref:Uncharacterized protein n=1 Tax=Verruconis gallopava TaxID=253628 RepID=A0A0D1XMW8_9PEZI|nr:uncharacterized protein PV09_04762 [Verruconis gallopava]KIW03921.1 hypothetical protein PV09_04762 [Verruconis gallopava]
MADNASLFVVKRTFYDEKPHGLEPEYKIALPATFVDLKAAKAFAKEVLKQEGYDVDLLPVYEVNNDPSNWKHGDGVIVYAKGPEGELLEVSIDTIANTSGLKAEEQTGRLPKPLFHVVQTIVDYNEDRSGAKRTCMVEATFDTEKAAIEYGLTVLLDEDTTKSDFVQYEEYKDGNQSGFGQDIIVHAIKEGGQNFFVSVLSES